MFRLRKATKHDEASIRSLVRRVHINPMDLDWRRFTVAVDEKDQVIGTGQIKPHKDGSNELASIAVQPEYQHQGIGTAIIEQLMAEYWNANQDPLYLMCRSVNVPYYERFGFRIAQTKEAPAYLRTLTRASEFFKRFLPGLPRPNIMLKENFQPTAGNSSP
jgi:N-acetylglutamate synthase-like GNAT family acetyltransferase